MTGPVPRDRPGQAVRHPKADRPAPSTGTPATRRIEALQRDVGNRAVAGILSVQRTSKEEIAQFQKYMQLGDFGRAAWQLKQFDAADLPQHINRSVEAWKLEALAEGAMHPGGAAVVDAIYGVSRRAATVGKIRFNVWRHNWPEAARYLHELDNVVAQGEGHRLEEALIKSGQLDSAGLAEIDKVKGKIKLIPGDAITVGGQEYIIYETEVRTGGTIPWRTHNPGALKSVKALHGSIGYNRLNFLIYPDDKTGKDAKRKDLEYQLFHNPDLPPDRTLLQVMTAHTPPGEGDPGFYADQIAKALGGGITRDSPVKGWGQDKVDTMMNAIFKQEGSSGVKPLARDDPKLPAEIRERL